MIDLSQLPSPQVIETLDFEQILAARKARLVSLYPAEQQAAVAAELELESDPRTKLLQESAYGEVVLRQRINDAARACLLAYAGGADLQHLAALYSVERLVTDPGDSTANPPIPPTYESDAALRYRTQLAPEGFSTAGPEGAYRFHALSASGDIADVAIDSPTPGQVRVAVLSADGDGTPTPQLLAVVEQALTADDVRPLTDEVIVVAAEVLPYRVEASLILYPGPTPAPVISAARAAVERYVQSVRRLGADVTRSGLIAALHQPGVQDVVLTEPGSNVVCAANQAAYCTRIEVLSGGVDE